MKTMIYIIWLLSFYNLIMIVPATKTGVLKKFQDGVAVKVERKVEIEEESIPFFLENSDKPQSHQHTSHDAIFGKHAVDYNRNILRAIDNVQGKVINGGGYYTNKIDKSRESPIGYPLKLFNFPLIDPPQTTSYCTGATYAAFIEALNLIFPDGVTRLTLSRYEALRMQELDGTRREDYDKAWGNWNSQWGAQNVMIKYLNMGKIVGQREARPGDFINIFFRGGGGHSAIFLGWNKNSKGEKQLMIWSSQPVTKGISDQFIPISMIASLAIVRLTNPGNIFNFNASKKVAYKDGEFERKIERFLL